MTDIVIDENRLRFINKELEESYGAVAAQHQQLRWAINLYSISVLGFFALAAFIVENLQQETEPTFLVVGYSSGILVFLSGWILLSFLGHKVGILILIYRHIAIFRQARLDIFPRPNDLEKGYVFPLGTEDKHRYVPGFTHYLPYIFFFLNYCILLGSTFFYLSHDFADHNHAINVSLCYALAVGGIFGLAYTRSCVTFDKHLRTAMSAKTLWQKKEFEEKYDNLRKASNPGIRRLGRNLAIVLALILLVLAWLQDEEIQWAGQFQSEWLTPACSIFILGLLGLLKFYTEKVKDLKVHFRYEK